VNILIVKLSALGDVVHTLPSLNALRRRYPEAHISWLLEEAAREIVEGHPAINRVIVWRRREFEAAFKSVRWLTAWRVFNEARREVRRFPFDLVIDFQGLFKSGLWTGLARGRRKVGFGRGMERSEGSHLFLTDPVPAVSMEVHALERSLKLIEAVGVPAGTVRYDFPIGDAARRQADDFLAGHGIKAGDRWVAVHPMTRWATKLWFNDRFAEVADALADRGLKVVFTGSGEDAPALEEIAGRMKSAFVRTNGVGGLKMLAALLERAAVAITTDTGPMHIAAAVGTPVVAIFGPTAPNRTGPYGAEHRVLRVAVPCSPCFSKQCVAREVEPMACMKRIGVPDVLAAVEEVLKH
jgi:lipopolysaccharide heptosyltransferase I